MSTDCASKAQRRRLSQARKTAVWIVDGIKAMQSRIDRTKDIIELIYQLSSRKRLMGRGKLHFVIEGHLDTSMPGRLQACFGYCRGSSALRARPL